MEEDPARAGSSGSAAAAGGAGGMSSAVASPSPRESWENDRAPRTHHVNAEEEDGVVSIPQARLRDGLASKSPTPVLPPLVFAPSGRDQDGFPQLAGC